MPPWATPGVGWPGLPRLHGGVADDEDLGMARHRQVRLDEHPTAAIGLGPGGGGHAPPEGRGQHAGSPQHGVRRDDLLGCAIARVGGDDPDGTLIDVGDPHARADGDPEALELPAGRCGLVGRVRRQDPVHRLDQDDRWRRPG